MFTGIVEEVGVIESLGRDRLRIASSSVLDGTRIGDSIAVDGCCLTVVTLGEDWWEAELSDETVARTSLSRCTVGGRVNLERAVLAHDRLGGHLVQGHVDGIGSIAAVEPLLEVDVPPTLRRYLVVKGSVTVDGVSLTVVEPTDAGFTVALIPHTTDVTTLGTKRPGDLVNIEVDVIAKYVEALGRPYAGSEALVGASRVRFPGEAG
jgi:riboflavin synthase